MIGAFEFLEQYAAPQTIQEIPLYYPQPYKDSERAYKRLITPEFLPLVHRSLAPQGLVVLQTDNRAYWNYIRRVAPLLFDFEKTQGTWPAAPQAARGGRFTPACTSSRSFAGKEHRNRTSLPPKSPRLSSLNHRHSLMRDDNCRWTMIKKVAGGKLPPGLRR